MEGLGEPSEVGATVAPLGVATTPRREVQDLATLEEATEVAFTE